MNSHGDFETNSDLSSSAVPAYVFGQIARETGLLSQVLPVSALSQYDQEIWRQFLARQPSAFLSYPYVTAFATRYPLVRVARIMTPDGRTVAFFPFQYRSRALAMAGIGERLGGELIDYFGLVAESGFHIEVQTLLQLSGLRSLFYA